MNGLFSGKSIRIKLFVWIVSLIFIFLLISLLFTTYLFKPYYLASHKKQFIETAKTLEKAYKEQESPYSYAFQRAERNDGFRIGVLNNQGVSSYDTFEISGPSNSPPGQQPPPQNMEIAFIPHSVGDSLRELGSYIFIEHLNPHLQSNVINIYYRIEQDRIIQLSRPIESIEKSIDIASRFIFFTGIIDLILGCLAALYLSKAFTTPIKKLKIIAQQMSRLDFSHKYKEKGDDEIAQLGRSINSLSDQLNHSITSLQSANKQLIIDIEQKSQIDEMRKEFISNVSHELRTPISLIKGYAEGLLDNVADNKESRDYYIEVILDESLKMEAHVNDLLGLSQIQAHSFSLEMNLFDMTALSKRVLTKYQKKLEELEIESSLTAVGPIKVFADERRVEQILMNYLNNAITHIKGDKVIALTLRQEAGRAIIDLYNSGDHIPQESLEKLWDSYYKVDKARTRQYGGYGLGLSIVKTLQEKQGNNYGVRNSYRGVTFWFDLEIVAD